MPAPPSLLKNFCWRQFIKNNKTVRMIATNSVLLKYMLTENQEKYLQKISADKIVRIVPFDPKISGIVQEIKDKVINAGINLEVKFMGASALGISGQGDIDLYIFCPEKDFQIYLPKLEEIFGPKVQGITITKWQLEKEGHEIEMYLTDPNTPSMQEQIKVFEILKNDPLLLKKYEEIKSSADGQSFREYMKRKYEFFNRILGIPTEPKNIAQQVNKKIVEWTKEKSKLVVAIDGYTGIGKTTLLNNLAELNTDIVAVNRDDFLLPREIVRERLAKAEDRSKVFELEVNDDKKLEGLVNTFKNTNEVYQIDTYNHVSGEVNVSKIYDFSKKVMVVEGVFMFHPQLLLNKLWDKRIYLDGDIEKIDEQRIKREKERWGKDYFPETHPDSYFKQVIIGLKRYIELYKPNEVADFILKV